MPRSASTAGCRLDLLKLDLATLEARAVYLKREIARICDAIAVAVIEEQRRRAGLM